MSETLTSNQQVTLKQLSERTYPWNPSSHSTKLMLAALGRLGFAQRRAGYPLGWEITDAGRSALARHRGEAS